MAMTQDIAKTIVATAGSPDGKGLLRFLACGSVDDGKSTLIGRLLYDTKLVLDDQLAALTADSRKYGTTGEEIDLALLMDGLEAEREQSITIDVGYRYFSTDKRSFIVADVPGHEQYTRNMATGASNADVAVILVDARKGIVTQTRRHSTICSLLGIRHAVLAINKIDLVDFSQATFDRIAADYAVFATRLSFSSITAIPISARAGDNVIRKSANTPWYAGPTVLDYLENVDAGSDEMEKPLRLPIQWVNRPSADFRGFSGTIRSGGVRRGDKIAVARSGEISTVADILVADRGQDSAVAGDAVTLTLTDEIDVARGDVLAHPHERPGLADQFAAHLVWMGNDPLLPGRTYMMRIGTRWVPASISSIKHRLDVNQLEPLAARSLNLNDIGFCNIATTAPVEFDSYADNRATGAFILVDRYNDQTVAAGMISFALRRATNIHRETLIVDKEARARALHQKPYILWFTGLSGSGKSTLAKLLEERLHAAGHHTYMLDGDNLRHGLTHDLGFTGADRVENIRRIGEVSKLFVDAGMIVLCAFISPFRAERQMVRQLVEPDEFIEVFVDTPIEECIRRDPKGLYAKAKGGSIKNFTGFDSPYEAPETPELVLRTMDVSEDEVVDQAIEHLRSKGYFA